MHTIHPRTHCSFSSLSTTTIATPPPHGYRTTRVVTRVTSVHSKAPSIHLPPRSRSSRGHNVILCDGLLPINSSLSILTAGVTLLSISCAKLAVAHHAHSTPTYPAPTTPRCGLLCRLELPHRRGAFEHITPAIGRECSKSTVRSIHPSSLPNVSPAPRLWWTLPTWLVTTQLAIALIVALPPHHCYNIKVHFTCL